MNLELTDEQEALRTTVRRFLADRTSATGTPAWPGLVELGTTGVLVPEDLGGAGMTMVEAGIVAEELGRVLLPGPWLSTAVAATRSLVRLGPRDGVAPLLTGIADGSTVATLAGAEDASPASWRSPRTRAIRSGGDVVLTGEKVAVPDAEAATVVLVVAGDDDGAGLYAVDPSAPGITRSPHRHVDPTRPLSRLSFADTPARRLGAMPDDAVEAAMDDLLIAWAADALGAAQAALDLAVSYAKVRTQFGQPIGAFQAVAHLCVDMFETIELARGGVIHGLWAADRACPEERHLAAVRTKAFAGRLATVGDTAIQVFGGIGFTWEHDAHRYLRRLLGWSAFLGPPTPYLQELGANLAGPARQMRSPT